MKQKEKYKGAAKRRHKTSTGMRCRYAKYVGPLQHTSRVRVAFESAHNVRKVFEMCLRPHRLTQKGKQKGCAFEKCTTQVSTGAAPRPLERRPVPEGRNSGWWRQPERLFERPQGASCAEGSDQPEFQAGVTGRRPFLGRHSFRAVGKNVGGAGIVFQKWK